MHAHASFNREKRALDIAKRILDFGITVQSQSSCKVSYFSHRKSQLSKLWTSPELLRMPNPPPEGTPKGDVYAFAIIAHEIVIRKGVFYLAGLQLTPKGKNPHASVNMCWSATLDGLFSCAGVSSGSEL
ncbi:hypothetical protein AVEN_59272-1 [Araneus ventricosus]|uniref:Protein kinase domain-containing protein n=1 Tax=Araneus ventricosus TaxID=182803 RepID=A0A4Y2G3V6_ARAVE|nr:hypothetical protein AVEN_59272-1 [Araneus ventricosus]